MKAIVLALGVGLAALAPTATASAQEPCATACNPGWTAYRVCSPQPVVRCRPVTRVYYPTCPPACNTPGYRYTTYRTTCWTPAYTCQPRVVYRTGCCR